MALAGGGVFLVGVGTGLVPLSAGGAALALVGLSVWYRTRRRVSRLTAELHETFETPRDSAHIFGSFVDVLEGTWRPDYAAFVEWNEDGSGGQISLERGSSRLSETSLVSWLLREAESGAEITLDAGGELSGIEATIALPLRRENSALIGFFVLCGVEQPPAHVLPALESCLGPLGRALAEAPQAVVLRQFPKKPELDPGRRRQARTLEA